jgi:lipopolysaccharide/colanic/teichoic acid biosynthesis glycosyltransferase
MAKRAFDLTLATIAAIVLSPIIAACALAVRATSPGPAFYRTTRIGRNERPFQQIKLRTMIAGAESGGFRTAAGDARITPFGRRLRALSLDELPQLWNVIRGDMSLVGPRPAAPAQLSDYTESQRAERARVRPGLTGLAQVNGRSSLALDQAIAYDLSYARAPSLWRDIAIIARTVPAVLARRGTN